MPSASEMSKVVAVSVWPTAAVPEIPGVPIAMLLLVVVVPPGQTSIAVRRQTGTIVAPTGSVVSKLAAFSVDALAVSHAGENS